jgi:hypothetical protein
MKELLKVFVDAVKETPRQFFDPMIRLWRLVKPSH